jgi:predicted transposase YdaD
LKSSDCVYATSVGLCVADDWFYIYLLVEFQSQPDHWMAMRMLVYVELLY